MPVNLPPFGDDRPCVQDPIAGNPFVSADAKSLEIDVAIVGAGPSGLYSAMRLAMDAPDLTVCIFDAAGRAGGRVLSLKPSFVPFHADVGAMRFLEHQALIRSVGRFFHLEEEVYDFPTWSFFVRGRDIRPKGFDRSFVPLSERPLDVPGDPVWIEQTAYRGLRKDPVGGGESSKYFEDGLDPGELVALGISQVMRHISLDDAYQQDDQLYHQTGMPPQELEAKIKSLASHGKSITYSNLKPYEWRAFKKYGKHDIERSLLYDLGFWDVLQKELTPEAYKFIEDGLGYQTIIGTWNAAEAIPWFLADFGGGKYRSFKAGMYSLCGELLDKFVDLSKRNHTSRSVQRSHLYYPNWKLESVVDRSTGDTEQGFELLLSLSPSPTRRRAQKSNKDSVPGDDPTPTLSIRAKKVVLAVSRGALKDIELIGFDKEQSAHFSHALDAVSSHPLLKAFMWYREPWWYDRSHECDALVKVGIAQLPKQADVPSSKQDVDFASGRVYTDLPLRMLYYQGPSSPFRNPSDASSRISVVMAYCDARHAEYWDAINDLRKFAWASNDVLRIIKGNPDDAGILDEFGVSLSFAVRMHEQLVRFHRYVADFEKDENTWESVGPLFVVFMNWQKPPYHGGWHSWKIRFSSDEWRNIVRKPFGNRDILTCGEAFSCDQGWIEGALKTAEYLLITQFKLDPATWPLLKEHVTSSQGYEVDESVRGLGYESIEHYCEM